MLDDTPKLALILVGMSPREWIRSQRLTLALVADQLGISTRTLVRYLGHRTVWPLDLALQFSEMTVGAVPLLAMVKPASSPSRAETQAQA